MLLQRFFVTALLIFYSIESKNQTILEEKKRSEEQINASLKEKDILLKEIHHRVKNNMQIISSLLSLQAMRIKDNTYQEFFDVCSNRIKAMALVHEILYQSKNLSQINLSNP